MTPRPEGETCTRCHGIGRVFNWDADEYEWCSCAERETNMSDLIQDDDDRGPGSSHQMPPGVAAYAKLMHDAAQAQAEYLSSAPGGDRPSRSQYANQPEYAAAWEAWEAAQTPPVIPARFGGLDVEPFPAPGGAVGEELERALDNYSVAAMRFALKCDGDNNEAAKAARETLRAAVRRAAEQGRREALDLAWEEWVHNEYGAGTERERAEYIAKSLATLADEGRGT